MRKPKIGILPLYLELYDNAMPEARPRIDQFRDLIVSQLQSRGLEVIVPPVCRVRREFGEAINSIEDGGADAIVTLHLAYSPSLESAVALASTFLPIIVLDTTPAFSYGPNQDPAELMYNHGIHGVQDMCNLLMRNGKDFVIEAGHWEKSDVLDRVAGWAHAAAMARDMRNSKVGLIGEPFAGMGDFAVEPGELAETIGTDVILMDWAALKTVLANVTDSEIQDELLADSTRFTLDGLDPQVYARSARVGLAVRRWIEAEGLSAFSMNFLAFTQASGLSTVPFLEASKSMARGVGYAGEGDVLTAALVGVLASRYPTTFTEMFCPDWEGNSIYLSHMGEVNVDLCVGKPVLQEYDFPWTDADNPVIAVGRLRVGDAVFVNLAPWGEGEYALIVSPVEMLDVSGEDKMTGSVHGWFRPQGSIGSFLKAYSEVGGTHHAALVYGNVTKQMVSFGQMMGWEVIVLDKESLSQ